jgi:DNA-directed RNA polymerase subunit RPC12/RpoP
MDIVFKCTNCDQELAVDSAGANTEIQCPTCNVPLVVPEPTPQNVQLINPIASSAAAKVEKHFSVPQRSGVEALIKKAKPTLEVAAKESDKQFRVKTIKHGDCLEVGKDRFDELATEFLQKIGQENIISVHPITYSHTDSAGLHIFQDFGLLIIFKG